MHKRQGTIFKVSYKPIIHKDTRKTILQYLTESVHGEDTAQFSIETILEELIDELVSEDIKLFEYLLKKDIVYIEI